MTNRKPAKLDSSLLAQKGTARPASGLRFAYPAVKPPEPVTAAAPSPTTDPGTQPDNPSMAPRYDTLAEASSLQIGGFKPLDATAEPQPPRSAGDTGVAGSDPEVQLAVPPAIGAKDAQFEPPANTSVSDATPPSPSRTHVGAPRPLILGGGFALLVLVSLAAGYAVSLLAQGGSGTQEAASVESSPPPPAISSATVERTDATTLPVIAAPNAGASPTATSDTPLGALARADLQYAVHIGSAPDRETAILLWQRLASVHADLLAGKKLDVRRVSVADGIDYWVQTGTFGEIELARNLCQKLRSHNLDCQVVKK